MAVYKVIQDIESEDKLVGPLTLKGFIYFAIAAVLAFINVRLLIAGGPFILRLMVILVLCLPMLLFGLLASPLGRDQPTEVWLLSHIRFFLKPKLRGWDQAGQEQLVTITAPKRPELVLTKGFSQKEVQSRLQALATTLDSHGWVVKNSAVNLSNEPSYLDDSQSDRLVSASAEPEPVLDIHASDDILDEQNNATAQHFNELMKEADNQRKQAIVEKIDKARKTGVEVVGGDSRFLDKSKTEGNTTFVGRDVVAPHADDDSASTVSDDDNSDKAKQLSDEAKAVLERENKRLAEIHRRSASFHTKGDSREAARSARELAAKRQAQEEKARQDSVTAAQTAAKLELAQSGNDLSVASIAHLANRSGQINQISPTEVEIRLH